VSTPSNRKSRRAAEKRSKSNKTGIKALSLLTSTGLISTGVSALTGVGAFATPPLPTDGCFSTKALVINASGDQINDASAISNLNDQLAAFVAGTDPAYQDGEGAPYTCATVTFVNSSTLNLGDNKIVVPSGPRDQSVFFYGTDASFEKDGEGSIIETSQNIYLADFTDINGTTDSPAIKSIASGRSVEVSNVTFSGNQSSTPGAAISAVGPVTVEDSVFNSNISQEGGGAIYSSQGGMFISGSSFSGNKSSPIIVPFGGGNADSIDDNSLPGHGGAIYSGGTEEVRILEGSFTDNESQGGNGGAVFAVGQVTVTGVLGLDDAPDSPALFSTNTAKNFVSLYDKYADGYISEVDTPYGGSGGAIYSQDEVILIDATTFNDNEASVSGGAIYAVNLFGADASDSEGALFFNGALLPVHTFSGNTAVNDGGAVWAGTDSYVIGGAFTSNKAGEKGGAVYTANPALTGGFMFPGTALVFSSFNENYAGLAGGGVYSSGDAISINTSFTKNEAGFNRVDLTWGADGRGGAIYSAGEVYVFDYSGMFPAEEGLPEFSIFSENKASNYGGAIYSAGVDDGEGPPASLISNSQFVANVSPNGGAVAVINDLWVDDSTFSDNQATNSPFVSVDYVGILPPTLGGAIWGSGDVLVDGSTFTNNDAVLGTGGAIYSVLGPVPESYYLSVENSSFINNDAITDDIGLIGGFGGAIYTEVDEVSVLQSTFDRNTAGNQGGAIYTGEENLSEGFESDLAVANSTFIQNEAQVGAALFLGVSDFPGSIASVVFNTFLDNIKRPTILAPASTSANKAVVHMEGQGITFAANLLADSTLSDTVGLISYEGYSPGDTLGVLEYNISTAPETDLAVVVGSTGNTFGATWSDLDLATTLFSSEEGAPGVLELGATQDASDSLAIDVVPYDRPYQNLITYEGDPSVEGVPSDQVGTQRFQRYGTSGVGVFDVGAFEFYGSGPDEGGPTNNAPEHTSGTTGDGTVGQSGTVYTATALDLDLEDTLTFSLDTAVSGFSINPTTGVVTFDGTRPAGDYVLTIVVSDGIDTDTITVTITVSAPVVPGPNPPSNSAPVFTGGSTGSGVSGTASTVYQASAVDSDGQAVSFALVSAVNASSSSVSGFSIESATGRVNMAADVPAGTYTLVIRASDGTSTTTRTVVITVSGSSSVVVGSSAKLVVPGFALDSAKLTLRMKKAIRKLVLANPELTTVTCRGFTSLPASARDMKLARQRGKAVCDYILKLNPDLTIKVLKGGHTEKTGSENRRVRIVMR
jgi:predicted outer membrane repeat protein